MPPKHLTKSSKSRKDGRVRNHNTRRYLKNCKSGCVKSRVPKSMKKGGSKSKEGKPHYGKKNREGIYGKKDTFCGLFTPIIKKPDGDKTTARDLYDEGGEDIIAKFSDKLNDMYGSDKAHYHVNDREGLKLTFKDLPTPVEAPKSIKLSNGYKIVRWKFEALEW